MTFQPEPVPEAAPTTIPLARSPGRRHRRNRWARIGLRWRPNDRAVSEVVSSMMMIAITVALVGMAGLGIALRVGGDEGGSALHVEMSATGQADEDEVTLQHVGGNAIDGDSVRALVAVDNEVWYDGPLAHGTWDVGDRMALALPMALPVGAHVSVALVHVARGETFATAEFDAPDARTATGGPSAGFEIGLVVAGGETTAVIEPPAELLVEARVDHAQGRKFVRFVYADLAALQGPVWVQMRDDGTSGDRQAGDGIYSTSALIPRNVTEGLKSVIATAVDLNGTRVDASAQIHVLKRLDVTEESLNPTGTPHPGTTPTCPSGKAAIRSYRYVINGDREVRDLTGNVRAGDDVVAYVTAAAGCNATAVSLVSYTAPSAVFGWQNATSMVVHDMQTLTLSAGREHALSVAVPDCYFQVSFAIGAPLVTMGPPGTNNYYSTQGRLIDADNGGMRAC